MDINELIIDEEKEAGVWIKFHDAEFKIAYGAGKRFVRASARIGKKYPQYAIKADAAVLHTMATEVIADSILVDWRKVTDKGEEIECTKENRLHLLRSEIFREWVAEQSREVSNYKSEALAEDASSLKSGDGVAAPVGGE